jgi:hypothetical protein
MSESNTNAVENTPVSRTITIYATRGNSEPIDIISSAVTWGDFIPEVKKAGYSVDKVLCTESHTRMDLVNKLAILPLVDFTIFIRNKETKSGATELSYKELRASIAGFMSEDFAAAKAHFGNYTTKTTVLLRELHASYSPVVVEEVVEEQLEMEEVVETNVADVVESVAVAVTKRTTNADRVEKISALLVGIVSCTSNEEILERVGIIEEEIEGLRAAITDDEEETFIQEETPIFDAEAEGKAQAVAEAKAKEEAKMAEEAELSRLAKEAKKIRKNALANQARELGL